MAGFFIPSFGGQGGGGGANPNQNAFIQVRFDNATNRLIFTTANGNDIPISLANIRPDITYVDANYDPVSGQLTLTRGNGQDDVLDLGSNGVQSFNYDANTRTITVINENGQQYTIPHIITEWKDLEYVKEYTDINLIDFAQRQNGVKFDGVGNITDVNASDNGLVRFDVVAGEEYTLIRQRANHGRICFYTADGGFIRLLDEGMRIYNGWNRLKFTAPQGASYAILELLVRQDNEKDVMVLRGDKINLAINTSNPIPYTDGNSIQVGSEVSLKFDNSNSTLLSTTVESAIKELNKKIANAGGGTVTSVNGEIPVDGNVNLSLEINGDDLEFKVENVAKSTLGLYTDNDANDLIRYFV